MFVLVLMADSGRIEQKRLQSAQFLACVLATPPGVLSTIFLNSPK
jgi:hypothetical protein